MLTLLFDLPRMQFLQRDWERRFRKFPGRSLAWKLHYYMSRPQYQTLLFFRLMEAARPSWLKAVFANFHGRASRRSGLEILCPRLEGGVIMPHWGRIILNATAIGEDLYVFHGVTVGNDYRTGSPEIGSQVFIGAGAIVLGKIRIGDRAVIAAGSVVVSDVPPDTLVAGNPARIIRTTGPGYLHELVGY
jgi:serine O-acetyltransferase